jgi:hypothetical protein
MHAIERTEQGGLIHQLGPQSGAVVIDRDIEVAERVMDPGSSTSANDDLVELQSHGSLSFAWLGDCRADSGEHASPHWGES